MTVTEFEARVSAYVDGELNPVEMAEMDRKAAECAHCRTVLADVQELTERMAQLPEVRPSAEFDFTLRSHLAMAMAKEKTAFAQGAACNVFFCFAEDYNAGCGCGDRPGVDAGGFLWRYNAYATSGSGAPGDSAGAGRKIAECRCGCSGIGAFVQGVL